MNVALRRLALLASVSMTTLGSAVHAASVTRPGVAHFDATDPVVDTLTICATGEQCLFGDSVTATAAAHAAVFDTAHGQINQTGVDLGAGGSVTLDLRNAGDVTIAAIASAEGPATASAVAIAATPIAQLGLASGAVDLDLANLGSLSVAASAHASGHSGLAAGLVFGGIHQQAISTGVGPVAVDLSNEGGVSIGALATAAGSGIAIATAAVTSGLAVDGLAVGGNAAAAIDNEGQISIGAAAHAVAGGIATSSPAASALAVVSNGIVEHADAGYDAAASLENHGSISISAAAQATGPGAIATASTGFVFAKGPTAFAFVVNGLEQSAVSFGGGNAEALLVNEGALDVNAVAAVHSTGIGNGAAVAWNYSAIDQIAVAMGTESAAATFDNQGSIVVAASASAIADDIGARFSGNAASASAQIVDAVAQQAISGGDASAAFRNEGTISVGGLATAAAPGAVARAAVSANGAVVQVAQGGGATATATSAAVGNASAVFGNTGTIAVDLAGAASGRTALGNAFIATGIAQIASAGASAEADLSNSGNVDLHSTGSAQAKGGRATGGAGVLAGVAQQVRGGDEAIAAFSNSGTIAIDALANAVSTGAGTATATSFASAIARIGGVTFISVIGAVTQNALADSAAVNLSNNGLIDLAASAAATGGEGARAAANIIEGIKQQARSLDGDAEAIMVNASDIDMTVQAVADGGAGAATAVATAGHAIEQRAYAVDGNALASFTNEGSFDVKAAASAEGDLRVESFAFARGITQRVIAGGSATGLVGEADFLNSVTFAVAASAFAHGAFGATTSTAGLPAASAIASAIAVSQQADFAQFTNAGILSIEVKAFADASGDAAALADARGAEQLAYSSAPLVQQTAANSGTIALSAAALASGATGAAATALAHHGMEQFALGATVSQAMTNSGIISLAAAASALAGGPFATAHATAEGALAQTATGLAIHQGMTNAGSVAETANAAASASGVALAFALAHEGMLQAAIGTSIEQGITNEGLVSIVAGASAVATAGFATAQATAEAALAQSATGLAVHQEMANAGTITASAHAAVSASGFGLAIANGHDAMVQFGRGASVDQSIANDGVISVLATAQAVAAGRAIALANPHPLGSAMNSAVNQFASGTSVGQAFSNGGTVAAAASVSATANGAVATTTSGKQVIAGFAAASAVQAGVGQFAGGVAAQQSLTNTGLIDVDVKANAHGPSEPGAGGLEVQGGGHANALSVGVVQENFATATNSIAFANDGTVAVAASAAVEGLAGTATAAGIGEYVNGFGGAPLHVDLENDGLIDVSAKALSPARAVAQAQGLFVADRPGFTTQTVAFTIDGSIVNDGDIKVSASADGFKEPVTGSTFVFGGSSALAEGIAIVGGANRLTLTNSGTIDVEAVAADGGDVWSVGVRATSNGAVSPGPDDVFTIVNDGGSIVARQSNDGGDSWHRGLAIYVTGEPDRNIPGLPSKTVVNLLGDGNIYGDFALNAGDEVNVADGTTYFDGVILPGVPRVGEIVFFPGVTAADLDSGLTGAANLTISSGGNLVLADPRITGDPTTYDGPAYAILNTLNVAGDGTLTYELQPAAGGVQPVGSYPQIFADTANLDGTLVAEVTPANGLFAESYSWNNVVDANVLKGKFDKCTLAGPYAQSLLLSFGCTYDAAANIDLTLTRTPFDEVAGLNRNGIAVGTGLDSYYDVGLTGGAANMFADLFLISDAGKYNIALNQLSGSVYANYLNSFPSLGVHQNDLVDHATNCEGLALASSALECRTSPIRVWGQLDYQSRKADGDFEAGDARSKRGSELVGMDASIGGAGIIGLDIGHLSNSVDDRQFGDRVKGNGWTGGLYAAYDSGPFYVKALGTYSALDGKAHRGIDFTGLGAGTSFTANPTGNADVKMWTFGLHGGARLDMGGSSVLTPYLNYDWVNAKLKGFDEANGNGAALTVESSSSKHSFLSGGAKWAARMGDVVPEVNLGYRYRFGSQHSTFHGWFTPDPDNDFDIISASQKRGTILAGLSVGGKMGPVDVRLGYEGEFNSDVKSHSGNLKLVLPLGRHAAPPPPPPSLAPPAPPAPDTQTCPDGSVIDAAALCPPSPPPSPPPAPVERGERGQ